MTTPEMPMTSPETDTPLVEHYPALTEDATPSFATLAAAQAGELELQQGREPVARPAAAGFVIGVGVLLILLGGVAAYELLADYVVDDWPPLYPSISAWILEFSWQPIYLIVPVVITLACVFALFAALRPRRRTHLAVGGDSTSVWVTPTGLARMSSAYAMTVDGVVDARSTASDQTVTIYVTAAGADPDELAAAVTAVVTPQLDKMATPPRLVVRVFEPRGGQR